MKKFEKFISLILLGTFVFNTFVPFVNASEINTSSNTEVKNEELDFVAKGNIEIETQLVLPIRNVASDINFNIYDSSNNKASINLKEIAEVKTVDKNVRLNRNDVRLTANKRDNLGSLLTGMDINNNIVYIAVNLYGLTRDTYKIEVSGTNFVTYTTSVTLDDFSKRVSITNETGMFEIGDVNKDNKVDKTDLNLVLNATYQNDTKYDLNLDGKTDIADLNYITAIINGKKKNPGIENTSPIIDSNTVTASMPKETSIESGTLSDIFTDSANVLTLKRNDDKNVSEDNPIDLVLDLGNKETETIPMSEIRIATGSNAPTKLTAIIEDKNGKNHTINWSYNDSENGVEYFTDKSDEKGIVIDLKGQIAVKKVTIKITETGSNNLADIAKVEFLNNVKVETKAPDGFDKPKNVKVDDTKSEQLTVTFNNVPNVTGYEISITGPKMENGVIFQTTFTSFTIEDLKNYANYKIKVRSANAEWRSAWSDEVEASPKATRRPPAVDMVTLEPIYSGFELSWKDMDDTKSYNIYYREVGEKNYNCIKDQKGTKYTLKGLKAAVSYEIYITGNNDLGEGSASQIVKGKTLKAAPTVTPKYNLINTEVAGSEKNNHIKDVLYSDGTMINGNKFSMVDDKFETYWEKTSWHAGTHYSKDSRVPIIVLDASYKMDEFVITVPDSYPYKYKTTIVNDGDVLLHYWLDDKEEFSNATRTTVSATLREQKDENNRTYYLMKLDEPIIANALEFGLTVESNGPAVQISEVKLYEYDSLVDDVANLFTDDLRLVLKDGVTKEKINELRTRADRKSNGEYNPYRSSILADLDYALKILNDEAIQDVITLNPNISNSYNNKSGFAMTINDYQPLGIVAKPKDKLTVYVGTNGKVNAEIVFTQYYAEAKEWQTTYSKLVKGQNIIEVPQIGDAEAERGGSVYIRYTSTPDVNNPIRVRVSGGVKIPVLDTTTLSNETEKKQAIETYINNLDKYVTNLKSDKSYVPRESVLDSTEIATRQGLFSVSAVAVKDALDTNTNGLDEKINRLYKSTEAFSEMIDMFYRQKGFDNSTDANKLPLARINIRYMRMFDGAFMYAGGYHIGIGYGSIAGLVQAEGNSEEKTGYFGWGISHEVGHQINDKNLVHAEVTNNVYALLAQTSNDKDKSRLEISNIYPKIYEKVTSGTLGKSQNVFVQLGMYWQLHLAYDNNNTFLDTNSIYARINQESRSFDNSKTKYTKDELLILFASKAANKDLTEFFEAWGLKAGDNLKNYLTNELGLKKETNKIQYLNDEARRYRLNNSENKFSNSVKVDASISNVNNDKKEVTLKFNINSETDKLLGYEILRNGEPIAFVTDANEYIDCIGSENNRAYTYQVIAYDKLLNKTEAISLEEIKISYDGKLASKDTFSIESNFKANSEVVDLEDSDMDYSKLSVNKLIDGKIATGFKGTSRIKSYVPGNVADVTEDKNNAYVIISLNDKYDVSGIQYRALLDENGNLDSNTINKYKIYVSTDKETWTLAKSGSFGLSNTKNEALVYFMKEGTDSKNQLWTYSDISYIKIESDGNKTGISGSEIDVIAPPGDNVDISFTSDNTPTIGRLSEDYVYDKSKGEEGTIKAGSVILKGEYRGSPSFNILTLNDANDINKIYDGYQLLFADINSDMTVYDVAAGTWFYIMSKEEYEKMLTTSTAIRVNLYRVNEANTNEGQRLTSTSKKIENLPSYNELKAMTITSAAE